MVVVGICVLLTDTDVLLLVAGSVVELLYGRVLVSLGISAALQESQSLFASLNKKM